MVTLVAPAAVSGRVAGVVGSVRAAFRDDIQALRAAAVVLVLLNHLSYCCLHDQWLYSFVLKTCLMRCE